MWWVRYEGVGRFLGRRWKNELHWHCVAYWEDVTELCPTELYITVEDVIAGERLSEARLTHVEGLAGSHPRFVREPFRNDALARRSAKGIVSLVFEGFKKNQPIFSGTWCESGRARPINEEVIELQASLKSHGIGSPPSSTKSEASIISIVPSLLGWAFPKAFCLS